MRKEALSPMIKATEMVQWLPGSLGARYPRVEDQFCGASARKQSERSQYMKGVKKRLAERLHAS